MKGVLRGGRGRATSGVVWEEPSGAEKGKPNRAGYTGVSRDRVSQRELAGGSRPTVKGTGPKGAGSTGVAGHGSRRATSET